MVRWWVTNVPQPFLHPVTLSPSHPVTQSPSQNLLEAPEVGGEGKVEVGGEGKVEVGGEGKVPSPLLHSSVPQKVSQVLKSWSSTH